MTEPTPAEPARRHTVTSDELDALQDELAALKSIATGYCFECGRGDCSPTPGQWYEQRQRADRAEAKVERVRDELDAITQDPALLGDDCECEAEGAVAAANRIRAALDEQQEQEP
jgi:hypothetical protein